jgi:hypothetical protein
MSICTGAFFIGGRAASGVPASWPGENRERHVVEMHAGVDVFLRFQDDQLLVHIAAQDVSAREWRGDGQEHQEAKEKEQQADELLHGQSITSDERLEI